MPGLKAMAKLIRNQRSSPGLAPQGSGPTALHWSFLPSRRPGLPKRLLLLCRDGEPSTAGFSSTRGCLKGFPVSGSESLDSVPLLVEPSVKCRGASWSPRKCPVGIFEPGPMRGAPLTSPLPWDPARGGHPHFSVSWGSSAAVDATWLRMRGFVSDLLYRLGRFRR